MAAFDQHGAAVAIGVLRPLSMHSQAPATITQEAMQTEFCRTKSQLHDGVSEKMPYRDNIDPTHGELNHSSNRDQIHMLYDVKASSLVCYPAT